MLVFNCTKAACEFFTVTRKGQKQTPVVAPPSKLFNEDSEHLLDKKGNKPELMQWFIHAIKVKRKHVLVAMELNSRYSMLFADLKKGDVQGFIGIFHERLLNNMQWYGESIDVFDELDDGGIDSLEEYEAQLVKAIQNKTGKTSAQFGEERPIPDNVVSLFSKE